MLVLDTDHISVLERADSVERARLIHRLDQAGVTAVVTAIVSYEEQSRGWLSYVARARSATDQVDAYERTRAALGNLPPIDRARLRALGRRVLSASPRRPRQRQTSRSENCVDHAGQPRHVTQPQFEGL